jgi:acyl-[acyl-carrier-protein] desaturase
VRDVDFNSREDHRKEWIYREYMDFFAKGEKTRRWNVLEDNPWEEIETYDRENLTQEQQELKTRLLSYCAVELFIPDYTTDGLQHAREIYGLAWFHLSWGYEESKHSLCFRKYLIESGLCSYDEYIEFEKKTLETIWMAPFKTRRQMVIFGALQERATCLIYRKQWAIYKDKNDLLEAMFRHIFRDEAAHASFYKKVIKNLYVEDPEGVVNDLVHVVSNFKMPGTEVMNGYDQMNKVEGVGLTSIEFLTQAVLPMFNQFGIRRSEFLKRMKHLQQQQENMIVGSN